MHQCKNLFLILSGIFFLFRPLETNAQGIIFFHGSYEEAKTEAKRQNKYVFVDCYEKGCAFCHMMAREVIPRQDVGDFYNAHFVSIKYDMYNGEGAELKNQFNIVGFPTFLYLDADGELANLVMGSSSPEDFIRNAKVALNDTNNIKGLTRRFNSGIRDTGFLKTLIRAATDADPVTCEKALAIYWKGIREKDLYKKENYDIFKRSERDINSPVYKYIFEHKDAFLKKFVAHHKYNIKDPIQKAALENDSDILYLKAADAIIYAADLGDSALFLQARRIAMKSKYPAAQFIACVNEIRYCKMVVGLYDPFLVDASEFLEKYGDTRPYVYNNFAREIVRNKTDETTLLEFAAGFCEKAMSYGKNYENLDTYARVLFQLKRYKEALDIANEAIVLAKYENMSYENTSDLLVEIGKAMKRKS